MYKFEFANGYKQAMQANLIAENMFAKCDIDGNQYLLMDQIIDQKSDGHAVEKANHYVFVNASRQIHA